MHLGTSAGLYKNEIPVPLYLLWTGQGEERKLFVKGSPLADKDNMVGFKIPFSQQSETRLNKLAMADWVSIALKGRENKH